jgi:hypothetical protein
MHYARFDSTRASPDYPAKRLSKFTSAMDRLQERIKQPVIVTGLNESLQHRPGLE